MSAEVGDNSITIKRGRGRPKGSKTKGRIRKDGESILVSSPIRRPMHYNREEAARELGISDTSLYQLDKAEGCIYSPAYQRGHFIIYTDTQIQIISKVMREKMTAQQGLEMWQRIDEREIIDLAKRGGGSTA